MKHIRLSIIDLSPVFDDNQIYSPISVNIAFAQMFNSLAKFADVIILIFLMILSYVNILLAPYLGSAVSSIYNWALG